MSSRAAIVQTRVLETRAVTDNPPPVAAHLQSPDAHTVTGRREGGVPESIDVPDGCRVRAVWWAMHLCGLTANGSANWVAAENAVYTTLTLQGTGRTECPSLVTRFETTIDGLPDGAYRFGTERKYVEFFIHCAKAP